MQWSGLLILLFNLGLNYGAERDEEGVMYDHTSLGIRPWYTAVEVKSVGYPSQAPYKLEQTWRYVAFAEDNKPKALKIICTDIYIPKEGSSCGSQKLKLEDGSITKEWCGEVSPFTMITATNDVTLKLYTGDEDGGRVFCTAQAIYLDNDRNEITTTTTTTTTPAPKNKYRFISYEGVDSSEHGGEEGDKQTSCPCGWANKVFSRIVNGTETGRNEFPFAAALIERDSRWRFCGSTIITEYHAITAAHCTDSAVKQKVPLAIIVGVHNLNDEIKSPAEIIEVERILQHQDYSGPPMYKHDLTLLILKSKITFSSQVGPACLPTHQVKLDRQYIKIIGWGGLYWQGPQSEFLRKVDVKVVPMDECNYEYSDVDLVKPTQICTYSKKGASCQGDSGGPVIWLDPETNRYTLVGAVSFGTACGLRPTVHTAIGHYLDWIQHYIKVSKGSSVCKKIH